MVCGQCREEIVFLVDILKNYPFPTLPLQPPVEMAYNFLMFFQLSYSEGNGIKFPSLFTWVRMAPNQPGVSALPVAESVIRVYCQSALGKAMTGSNV